MSQRGTDRLGRLALWTNIDWEFASGRNAMGRVLRLVCLDNDLEAQPILDAF